MRFLIFFFTLCCFWITSLGWAGPAIVYIGKKADGAYNQSLHQGVEEFQSKQGIECAEIETPADGSTYIATIQQCIAEKHSPIILPYASQRPALTPIISQHKDTNFIFLSFGEVDLPNVQSFSFADEEGGFLAGALAALMSKTRTIGFVYTSDQHPTALHFRAGYIQGAKFVDPAITIVEGQLGNKQADWSDTQKAQQLAARLIAQKADVLFPVVGYAGLGVLAQAAKGGIYAIGVDINQNSLYPETIIGSLIKHNGKAVYIALSLTSSGTRRDGVKRLQLIQSAMEMQFNGIEEGLVPQTIKDQLERLKNQIILGQIKIARDYKPI